jgi:hypothetical protein
MSIGFVFLCAGPVEFHLFVSGLKRHFYKSGLKWEMHVQADVLKLTSVDFQG